jgi:hypothetical protein
MITGRPGGPCRDSVDSIRAGRRNHPQRPAHKLKLQP